MVKITDLKINGFKNQSVPNTFFSQASETDHLAIIFPGLGYKAAMPVLYYPTQFLVRSGADVLLVEYEYDRRRDYKDLSKVEKHAMILADAKAACEIAQKQRHYSRITLIGKSLGTSALGLLLENLEICRSTDCIWLTPLLLDEQLREQIRRFTPEESLFVIGTADRFYNSAYLEEVVQATAGESLVIKDADHSLEIQNDIHASIQVIEEVMQKIQTFLEK